MSTKYFVMDDPNKNIMIVQEVENLANQVMERLRELESTNIKQRTAVDQAKDGLDVWQRIDLQEIRKVFE